MLRNIIQALAQDVLIDLRIQMHIPRNNPLIAQREKVADHRMNLSIQHARVEMLLGLEMVIGDLVAFGSEFLGLGFQVNLADLLGRQGDCCKVVGQSGVVVQFAIVATPTSAGVDAAAVMLFSWIVAILVVACMVVVIEIDAREGTKASVGIRRATVMTVETIVGAFEVLVQLGGN